MKAIPYSEILKAVWFAMGYATDQDNPGQPNPDTDEWHASRIAINRALRLAWNETFWPDLTITEQRRFKPNWDQATAYAAGDVVFYPPTALYYQALRATTGNAPAIVVSSGFTTNTSYWADTARSFSADVWSSTKQYANGDVVYDADTFTYHQAFAVPPIGNDPSDTTYWGRVTPLDPVIPYTTAGLNPIGRVAVVYQDNPKAYRGAREIPFDESQNGIQIRSGTITEPWVKYLRRPLEFRGDVWDATVTYTPVSEEDAVIVTDLVGATTANVNTYLEFDTLALLLAYPSNLYRTAMTHNYVSGDGVEALWIRTDQVGLVDNGDSVRQTADGRWIRRWEVDVS
ncbi:MAG: hypothetical protein E6Q97_37605 [Desulfurellales bacterium]|nr:MAG: hypothetical protein E6Q97_37605 [Desulfurellales bacterium]